MRDDFSQKTIETLAKRANHTCTNPDCRTPTSGPHTEPDKFVNIGVAAHISAASAGGKRYNSYLSQEQRSDIRNAIWLCHSCSKLVDSDDKQFPEELLHKWKKSHEESIFRQICSSSTLDFSVPASIEFAECKVVPSGKGDASFLFITLNNFGAGALTLDLKQA